MKTYAAIKAEIAKLEKRAEEARKAEIAGVIGRIKQAIDAYGLTAEDLGFGRPVTRGKLVRESKPAARSKTGVARYRDPATGKTWTGQGRPPAWIAAAADREAFLIGSAASNPMAGREKAARKARAAGKREVPSKGARATKTGRLGRKTATTPARTASIQIESSAASE